MEEFIQETRELGKLEYDQLDEIANNFTHDQKIVAASGYLDKYILMSLADLQTQIMKHKLEDHDDISLNIIELVLFEEEKTLFELLEKKNKTDPYVLLKVLIFFPKFVSKVYLSASGYSLRNISLITLQMIDRELTGPVKTFKQWSEIGVKVKKGERGIGIIVPNRVQIRRRGRGDDEEMTYFNFRKSLFSESQTDSEGIKLPSRDDIFDKIAEKHNISLDASETEILTEAVVSISPKYRRHVYNLCALILGMKTKDLYDTIIFVNETPPKELRDIIPLVDRILKH